MNLANLSLTDLKNGWHSTETGFACNYCQATWPQTSSPQQRQEHLELVHGGNRAQLLHLKSRYNTLTPKQQDLLTAFASGIKDQELADQLQVAAATIRHQKFTFREKAKQAKLYLAIYESVFAHPDSSDQLIEPPAQATMLDDRWLITEDEIAQTLQQYFNFDQEPIRLKRWPKKQKTIIIVLTRIITEIPIEQPLTEPEINSFLKPVYFDYVTVRRYLIDYGFLQRSTDGREYRRPNDNRKD